MSLDLTSLENAISNLEIALQACDYKTIPIPPNYKQITRSATIQAFEYTYGLSFKMMRRYLKMASDTGTNVDDMTFGDVIRAAHVKGIILSDLENWKIYRKKRGITSHTYDDDKAQDVFTSIPSFLDEARYVLARLQEMSTSLD